MKAIILTALIFSAVQTFGQESQKKAKQNTESEKVQESPPTENQVEQRQNAVPNISHKSTEPVEIELKVAEPAIKKEESPE